MIARVSSTDGSATMTCCRRRARAPSFSIFRNSFRVVAPTNCNSPRARAGLRILPASREPPSVSKLIGAPPGYVGFDEAGRLTEQVRRQPYSLILLDEIEKAHPDVLNIFLQIMEDGRLTDAQGRTVSFKDTLIIMTSNAGSDGVEASVGFGASKQGKQQSVMNRIGDYFKPEFLNRFDAIIEFQPLTKSELIVIVDLLLDNMNTLLANQDIHVSVDDAVKEQLVELGYDPKLGARPLRRVIQNQIEDQVADTFLKNKDIKQIYFTVNEENEIVVDPLALVKEADKDTPMNDDENTAE